MDMHAIAPTFLDLRNGRISPMEPPQQQTVICLGNFDGVHQAHTALIRRCLSLRDQKLPNHLCGIFTFFHPSSDYRWIVGDSDTAVLREPGARRHLTTLKEKLRLFSDLGLDFVCLCDFGKIHSLSPQAFLAFLSDVLHAKGAVCGFNFHFGKGSKGDAQLLAQHFDHPDCGCYYDIAPPFCIDDITVSSTHIRRLLQDGLAETACRYLGHPYTLEARVVTGKQLGRKLGFPTANQYFLPESLVPAHGVYAVLCHTPLGRFPGVANIGSHPTVDLGAAVNCETHIIGPAQDLYGYCMRVEFLYRLRDEKKFSSIEELTDTIRQDADAATAYVKDYVKNHP